ncbi:hypothetical protein Purlil1_12343 [Purpureocillium lilacinum]|uniref:Frequency clock protein n=1 Tax=Purpureocillium lilacinum TaxID=33203 RepID=A0ABR0BH27_PURLI|nr:hypothetical protein Purlil1_12343 [Purpureocillium lilacinum]
MVRSVQPEFRHPERRESLACSPFFQKQSDSTSDSAASGRQRHWTAPPTFVTARSSGGEDYRSVIDDLSIEIRELKAELKHYKRVVPRELRKDRLFEVKIYDLPQAKRDELESLLQGFVQELGIPKDRSTLRRDDSVLDSTHVRGNSMSASASTHASWLATQVQPPDSAYATMIAGANTPSESARPETMSARIRSSVQNDKAYVHDAHRSPYLRDETSEAGKRYPAVGRMDEHPRGGDGGVSRSSHLTSQQRTTSDDASTAVVSGRQPHQTRHNMYGSGSHASERLNNFHYHPLVCRQESSSQTSAFDASSSTSSPENGHSNFQGDRGGLRPANAKKRKLGGGIIYYAGAPFYTDTSGSAKVPQLDYAYSDYQGLQGTPFSLDRYQPYRCDSGSSLSCRSLSERSIRMSCPEERNQNKGAYHGLDSATDDRTEVSLSPPWTSRSQRSRMPPLEPSGIGGVIPEDHFTMRNRTHICKGFAPIEVILPEPFTNIGSRVCVKTNLAT